MQKLEPAEEAGVVSLLAKPPPSLNELILQAQRPATAAADRQEVLQYTRSMIQAEQALRQRLVDRAVERGPADDFWTQLTVARPSTGRLFAASPCPLCLTRVPLHTDGNWYRHRPADVRRMRGSMWLLQAHARRSSSSTASTSGTATTTGPRCTA